MTTTAHTDTPVTGEDLATEILRRRRKRLPAVTAALALAVAVAAGIIGGMEIQKHWGSTSSSSSSSGAASGFAAARSAFASRFGRGGGSGGFGGPGGAGAGGGATVGTVTLIKGSTLYVTESSGNTILVQTSPGARVTKTVTGTIQTIHPGDTVTVLGTQAANGSVTASSVAVGATASNG